MGTQTQDGYHKWNGISSRMQLWLGGVLVIVEFSFVMNNVCSPCQKGREKKWRDAQYNGLMHQWRRAVSGQIFCGSFILLRFISDNLIFSPFSSVQKFVDSNISWASAAKHQLDQVVPPEKLQSGVSTVKLQLNLQDLAEDIQLLDLIIMELPYSQKTFQFYQSWLSLT